MNRTQSNIGTAVTLAVALLVAWVCSLNSLTISGIPLFGFCALIIFVIQYVIFIPSYLNQTEHFFDLTGSLTFISISILSVALSPNLSLIKYFISPNDFCLGHPSGIFLILEGKKRWKR